MSILSALAKAYKRLPDTNRPPYGFSAQKIGFLIALNEDGTPAGKPRDLRTAAGKKLTSPLMQVPQPVIRTAGIAPNFLWDRTSYVLGVTAGDGKRLSREHEAFLNYHLDALSETEDAGLEALTKFLEWWVPERFATLAWPEEIKDQNVVFALESERLQNIAMHDRAAAHEIWAKLSTQGERSNAVCLVTGEEGPVARLHPAIKGVWGGRPSGASLVSFNLDAFRSYGHEQGDNAPVSELAAFAYTTALNRFLEQGSKNRIQIGDASTVFWADASNAEASQKAEGVFAAVFTDVDEEIQAEQVGVILQNIRLGQPLKEFEPDLAEGVRFHVLGLAPNAARLSIRFWLEDDFGELARNYQRFVEDMRIEPPPRDRYPALWKYLAETAVLGKRENIPPNLAGAWMRSILTGTPYPLTLLSTVLMRLRADRKVKPERVSILKALLMRNFKREVPVALSSSCKDKGYLLGRLFAAYEYAQAAALGQNVNSTIKDKYYGAAAAQPRKVFSLLEKSSANHLSKAGKKAAGLRVSLEKHIAAIMEEMSPEGDPFPVSLSPQDQALFGLGYYHQRNDFFKSRDKVSTPQPEAVQ